MSTFAEIAGDIIQKKLTGLLSIVPKNSNSHLKVFFSNGEIYYMGFGDLKGADCLGACESLELTDCFFGSGARVNVDEKISLPTSAIVEHLKKYTTKTKVSAAMPRQGNAADIQGQLKTALTRQIGPVGDMVFAKTVAGWHAASPPSKQDFAALAELLKEAIEDEKGKNDFTQEANAIIS